MLHLASYDIVFQEIPGEVTLALNISGCPNRCPGCHSPYLQEDTGEQLDDKLLSCLLDSYGNTVTCICFMGGDGDHARIERLSALGRQYGLKTAWYSGRETLPPQYDIESLDYLKLGPYIEKLGGLDSKATNQKFYKVEGGKLTDMTAMFTKD